jgi:hypothetical protein
MNTKRPLPLLLVPIFLELLDRYSDTWIYMYTSPLKTKDVFLQCHHMSLMDFVVSPPGCGRCVTGFWGWDAHEAQFRCPDEVDGDMWIWSTRRGLNLSSTKLPRPWSPWESSHSRKNPHGNTGNRTRDLTIRSQKLWPLDHEAGHDQSCLNYKIKL